MAILNNLYPPIVDTYAPAFLINSGDLLKDTCRIYFSLSPYNGVSDIKNVQVSVVDQNTNNSYLNKDLYPSEIMLTALQTDIEKTSNDKYFIEIKKTDVQNNSFEINQYYKVQLRFTSTQAENPPSNQKIDSWLTANLNYFSEWSTVCLIRGISTPSLILSSLEESPDTLVWSSNTLDVIGKIYFEDSEETDTLKSYNLKILNDLDEIVADSGIVYNNNYVGINEINYSFKYNLQDGNLYKLVIEYTTKNLYTESKTVSFLVMLGATGKMDATITAVLDEDNGRIGLHIKSNSVEKFTGNMTIRRSSSKDDFSTWDDIYTLTIENQLLDLVWYDYTIESGVWYRYCIQQRDSYGNRGVITELKDPVMILFEHILLTAGGTQLKIEFDPQISSFKYNVAESKTDTIGSKYTFIKRNGVTYYREFPINGLVSFFMDGDKIFTSREDIYADTLELYEEYNDKHRINPFNDIIYERDFREKVMDFLYKNEVKLFRSPTEGNILVKLMNISFTPNQTLGRQIYSFSCTAYEIDENTIENCDLYNIQEKGEISDILRFTEGYTGQLNEICYLGMDVVQDMLSEKYQKLAKENYIMNVENLDYLRLEIESDPYLIKESISGPIPINDIGENKDINLSSAYLGYIVNLNNKPIVINPEGIYELKGEGVKISSISFPVDTKINLYYHANISQTEDKKTVPISTVYSKKVGQHWGIFDYQDDVYQKIWNKYYEYYDTHMQTLSDIVGLSIEAEPGTVVYVKEYKEPSYDRHVIGPTCLLAFEDENSIINGIYFSGIHFEEATDDEKARDILPDLKYMDTGITVSNLNEISQPIKNGVYTLQIEQDNSRTFDLVKEKIQNANNENYNKILRQIYKKDFSLFLEEQLQDGKYIWYNDKWWLFTDNHDIITSTPAIINYTCEIMKGTFARN